LSSVDPPQLETAWFQPLDLKCDLLVSSLCFSQTGQRVPLRHGDLNKYGGMKPEVDGPLNRRIVVSDEFYPLVAHGAIDVNKAGPPRRTLTPLDPQLKGAGYPGGFHPLRLSSEKPVSSLCFQMQLVPLQQGRRAERPGQRGDLRRRCGEGLRRRGGAVNPVELNPVFPQRLKTPGFNPRNP
jgi:hypothetical protein